MEACLTRQMYKNRDIVDKTILECVEYELKMFGETLESSRKDNGWYRKHEFSTEQFIEWKKYCLEKLKKIIRLKKDRLKEFMWINFQWGYTIKDDEEER